MILKVLSIGDNCIDHYVELGKRYPGGNALNIAIYANRIPGITAEYIGVIGTDEPGDFIKDQIQKQGLDTTHLTRLEGKTAVTTILIKDGDRVFDDYTEGVQENAEFPQEKLALLNQYDLIHYTVWGFGREHVPQLKTRAKLSCDFSNQLQHQATEIMPYLEYSFFSGSHLIKEGKDPGTIIKELKEKTPGIVIMTLGENGSLVYDGDKLYEGTTLPVDVVDTLGAGDAYIAAFLCSQLKGENIQTSIEHGHQAARDICTRLGGWGGD